MWSLEKCHHKEPSEGKINKLAEFHFKLFCSYFFIYLYLYIVLYCIYILILFSVKAFKVYVSCVGIVESPYHSWYALCRADI